MKNKGIKMKNIILKKITNLINVSNAVRAFFKSSFIVSDFDLQKFEKLEAKKMIIDLRQY